MKEIKTADGTRAKVQCYSFLLQLFAENRVCWLNDWTAFVSAAYFLLPRALSLSRLHFILHSAVVEIICEFSGFYSVASDHVIPPVFSPLYLPALLAQRGTLSSSCPSFCRSSNKHMCAIGQRPHPSFVFFPRWNFCGDKLQKGNKQIAAAWSRGQKT